jgi:hypothetical protein
MQLQYLHQIKSSYIFKVQIRTVVYVAAIVIES